MSHRELSDSKRESQFPEPRRHNITESAQRVGSALLVLAALLVVSLLPSLLAQQSAAPHDLSPHTVRFINVDKNVNLEVLDWGGSGRPLVLLAGLGDTAHVYDKLAPKLTTAHHVYGITRRGFGASSAPVPGNTNYTADRLGDDVLAVFGSLKLDRPVLVGHSIAGEELSSVGSRYPEKIAGLIYLDAGYSYAYYDRVRRDGMIDAPELRKKLEQLIPGTGPEDPDQVVDDLLQMLPQFEKALCELQKDLRAMPAPPTPVLPVLTPAQAILAGQQKYTDIRVPALAIYAIPHDFGQAFSDPAARAAAEARDLASFGAQAKAFESGMPNARVVRLARASHFVFISNEADVLRDIRGFLASLN